MSQNDPLASALSHIKNCEVAAKKKIIVGNSSKIIKEVLMILKNKGFIENFTEIKSTKGSKLEIDLKGAINGCGAVKPRYSVASNDFEKFEKRYLPAKDFGFLIVSTNQGIMVHTEAIEKNLGGRLIAYCY